MNKLIKPFKSKEYFVFYESLIRFIGNIVSTTFLSENINYEVSVKDKILYHKKMIKALENYDEFKEVNFYNFEAETTEVMNIIKDNIINKNIAELNFKYMKSLDDEYFLSPESSLLASNIEKAFEEIYFEASFDLNRLRDQWIDEMTTSYEIEIKNLNSKNEDLNNELLNNLEKNEILNKNINLNNKKIKKYENDIEVLKKQILDKKNILIEKNKEIEILKNSLKEEDSNSSEEDVNRISEELNKVIKEKESFKKKVFELVKEINTIKKNSVENNCKLNNVLNECSKKEKDINILKDEILEKNKKIRQLERIVKEKEINIKKLKDNNIKFTDEEINNIKFNKIPEIEKLLRTNIFLIFDNKFIYNECESIIDKLNIKKLNQLVDKKDINNINSNIEEIVNNIRVLKEKSSDLDFPVSFDIIIDKLKKLI
ncbi:hypothetical protein ACV3T9_09150 [Clostridium perfringens]